MKYKVTGNKLTIEFESPEEKESFIGLLSFAIYEDCLPLSTLELQIEQMITIIRNS